MTVKADEPSQSSEHSNDGSTQQDAQDVVANVEDDSEHTVRPNGAARPMSPELPSLQVSAPSPTTPTTPTTPAYSPNPETVASLTDRSSRRRSIMDPRGNRLSGFLSHLIRRDRENHPDNPNRTDRPSSPPPASLNESIAQNLATATRSATPPPALSPPTLYELGLSLSVLTSSLSPSHFSTSPTNGAFLSPHYLLLCHSQGLDVLPLVRPPAPEPYAIIRRVAFKSVLVMEERGILVAIAGRRDGVRFYSLEDIRKAIEWRMDEEIRKELERRRKEDAKYGPSGPVDNIFAPVSTRTRMKSKESLSVSGAKLNLPISGPPIPTTSNNLTRIKTPPTPRSPPIPQSPPRPRSPPPQYEESLSPPRPRPRSNISMVSVTQPPLPHRASVSTVVPMPGGSRRRPSNAQDVATPDVPQEKPDTLEAPWDNSSDEAINVVAAGPSGSAALDERTSAIPTSPRHEPIAEALPATPANIPTIVSTPPAISRPRRPSDLDLSGTRLNVPDTNTSPVATLSAIRQSLARTPALAARGPTIIDSEPSDIEPEVEERSDEARTPTAERISFAQALMESRLPDLPPPGTRQPQQPLLIGPSQRTSGEEEEAASLSADERRPSRRESVVPQMATSKSDRTRRRRWTVLDGIFNSTTPPPPPPPPSAPPVTRPSDRPSTAERPPRHIPRTASQGSIPRSHSTRNQSVEGRPQALTRRPSQGSTASNPTEPRRSSIRPNGTSNRFFPRIFSQALSARRSEDGLGNGNADSDILRKPGSSSTNAHGSPPKFDCMKLVGIKNAVMIKAVETSKKSFLAILCGDAGEKVELYAGTYRTNLGLSRTFILPDSPRNIELQLQGDDLIEVFLVFSHNVFGLEPATVRVREIRVGRSEREAARRRARALQNQTEQAEEDPVDEETNVAVTIEVSEPQSSETGGSDTPPSARPDMVRQETDPDDQTWTPVDAVDAAPTMTETTPEDLLALTASQMGAYTTFQQLSFSPQFPLAAVADDWIIPPTYPDVTTQYGIRTPGQSEPEPPTLQVSTPQVSTPPGLPLPQSQPPTKWYYKDPKGIVQGPWKASIMQAWYKEGYLPVDLPVRRENETEYITLQELRLQSVDPNHPFRPARVSPSTEGKPPTIPADTTTHESLLRPISLLAQPKHYGPPALFFSSRGGHSTSIVDGRGKSVLKGRLYWTVDDEESSTSKGKLGDIKRVEAFDVRDRAVIVVLRQGGLEAVDVGDALLPPAAESRTMLPDFKVPNSAVSRRGTYVWRIGSPVSLPSLTAPHGIAQTALTLARKKHSSSLPGRSPGKLEHGSGFEEPDIHPQEEVLFLGRNEDNVYICERNAGTFRILRLSPSP